MLGRSKLPSSSTALPSDPSQLHDLLVVSLADPQPSTVENHPRAAPGREPLSVTAALSHGPQGGKASRSLPLSCYSSRSRLQVGWGLEPPLHSWPPCANPSSPWQTCPLTGPLLLWLQSRWELSGAYSWASPSDGDGSPAPMTPSLPAMLPGSAPSPLR